jgi:hypothetical protein
MIRYYADPRVPAGGRAAGLTVMLLFQTITETKKLTILSVLSVSAVLAAGLKAGILNSY